MASKRTVILSKFASLATFAMAQPLTARSWSAVAASNAIRTRPRFRAVLRITGRPTRACKESSARGFADRPGPPPLLPAPGAHLVRDLRARPAVAKDPRSVRHPGLGGALAPDPDLPGG